MNFKHLILLSLFVYLTFAAQACNTIAGSCNRCQANGCDWCDGLGFGFFQCVDAGTCAKTPQTKGTCDVACADYTKCTDCKANNTCSYCSFSGFGSCNTGACTAPYNTVETCPKICDTPSAPIAGKNLCNLPGTNYNVPSNESFSLFFETCRKGGLGYPTNENATASNCSDKCTIEYSKLSESCIEKQLLLTCGVTCPKCDDDMTIQTYLSYFPCKSFCDDVNTTCNSQLSEECKINLENACSSDEAKCNKLTGVTGAKANIPADDCVTKTSAAATSATKTSAGQTSNGQTSAGQTSNGQTSAGQTSGAKTSAGQTSAAQTSKTSSSSSSTGSAGSIFVCVILGFFALLI